MTDAHADRPWPIPFIDTQPPLTNPSIHLRDHTRSSKNVSASPKMGVVSAMKQAVLKAFEGERVRPVGGWDEGVDLPAF
jgi:hypothetical protein